MGKPLTGLVAGLQDTPSRSLCLREPRLPSFREEPPCFGAASKTSPAQHPGVLRATACPSPAGRQQPHHALSPEEVGDQFSIQVVHEASRALVVAATVDEELLPGVLIDEGADLKWGGRGKMESCFFIEV